MEHYYTSNPQTPHDIREIVFSTGNVSLKLYTDAGVFSKNKVDYGSELLIRSLPGLSGDILDLGCGYGVIGLSIALANPETFVTMADLNHRAVDLALKNVERNHIPNASAQISDGFRQIDDRFQAIVSNPPIRAGKKIVYPLLEQSMEYLLSGGSLYLVIRKKQGAKSAADKLRSVFGNCEVRNKQGGYWILESKKAG